MHVNTWNHTRPAKGNHHCGMFCSQRPRLFYVVLYEIYVTPPQLVRHPATATSYCKSPREPIMLEPLTFTHNAGVMKMERQHEEGADEIWALRPSKPCCPSPPWNCRIWGEIMRLRSSATTFLIPSGLPHRTLLASKNPLPPPPPRRHPLARNHLRGLFQIAKSFSTVSVSHNAQKQAFLPFEDGTLCGLSDLSVEDEGKNAKQSVARPWKSHMHTHIDSHDSFTWSNWQKHTLCILVFTSPAARKAIIAAHAITFGTMSVELVSLPGLKGLLNTA